jgi:hypothetical protein
MQVPHVSGNGISISDRYGGIERGVRGGRECEIEAGRATWARGENRAPLWGSIAIASADICEVIRLCVTPYSHVGADFLKGCGGSAGVYRLEDGVE